MGFFEAACVIYLRRLWELGDHDLWGFSLSNRTVLTEFLREGASLVMIAAVAWLAGRRATERLACAAITFGAWDILYYVYLRLLIGWPATLLDWDILFLIPAPWSGPVLAPIAVSAFLVAGGGIALALEDSARPIRPRPLSWALALLGGGLVIASFLAARIPYETIWAGSIPGAHASMSASVEDSTGTPPGPGPLPKDASAGTPPGPPSEATSRFPWPLFLVGLATAIGGFVHAHRVAGTDSRRAG